MKLGLFVPCFVDACFPAVAESASTILKRLGYNPEFISGAICCGQPLLTMGCDHEARDVAKKTASLLEPYDVILALSGSCTSMARNHYPHLAESLAEVGERVVEISEFLVAKQHLQLDATFPGRAVVHQGCHGMRGIGLTEPTELLKNVKGLELLPCEESTACCGFGGVFSVKLPEVSVAMAQTKMSAWTEVRPDIVVSTEAACLMHLQAVAKAHDFRIPILHYIEVLASR